ncbi:MAG TPA: tRNA (5-methylaminomethyl-2-thiouridine)(34)-methyltransferase MnmD [Bacteroidales bacterium]|nr:tRNA (5-methylaminomethyl-2-thiouridine)(34)-methyltransferase MnmD [Bacteroidales bacterium]
MKPEIVRTADGSSTLFVPGLNEHYHSVHGAVQESMHVFIGCGLLALPAMLPAVHVFEMGFGTGLNALLTYYNTIGSDQEVLYTAIDAYPIQQDITERLNYPGFLDYQDASEVNKRITGSPWGESVHIGRRFTLARILARIQEYDFQGYYDLVYYDAFSPVVQPECWVPEIFFRIFQHMNPGGILVTYSSKGSVRRALHQAGFIVEKLPGPPGKREILRGRAGDVVTM